ncbi:hypothetical protein [Klebsiella pneumoniae]|uniref:hypothetical protein n=1 Tax=Klebsiella pneumoniae TaxID=573 RepID=UPI000F51E6AA|nr:hypothetical protein [Klebsiella pneumoniae]
MIEQKILSKEQVRTAFLEDGLLNFRKPLIPLPRPHIFPKPEVYSFDIGENSNLEIKKEIVLFSLMTIRTGIKLLL